MKLLSKFLIGFVLIFVLLIFAGAIYESQQENEIKNAETEPYTVVNFWSAHQPTAKRFSENILTKTTDHDQILLIAKKEILRLKEDYNADVVWLNIGSEVWRDNPKILKKEIARITWFKFDAEPKPSVEGYDYFGAFAGGDLYVSWS